MISLLFDKVALRALGNGFNHTTKRAYAGKGKFEHSAPHNEALMASGLFFSGEKLLEE
jgi:hypothetical protein